MLPASQRPASLSERLNTAGFFLLVVFVAVAPFPYGGVLPGGTLMIEIVAFATVAIALATGRGGLPLSTSVPAVALLLIAMLGLVQLIPNSTLSPMSAQIYADANRVLQMAGHAPATPRISVGPAETKTTILLTLAYAALFTAATILTNTRARRRILAAALLVSIVPHALLAGPFGVESPYGSRLHGTFINADHFAGYLEIGLAFAFGVIWAEVLTGSDRTVNVRDRSERMQRRLVPLVWRVIPWAVIAAAIALTQSRGGVLASILTTIIVVTLALIRRRSERAALMTVIATVLAIAFVVFTTGEAALLRFLNTDLTQDVRVHIWQASVDAWRMFPTFGAGLGAFAEAFRRVQPPEVPLLTEQAHNDFLQLLVTGGWIGALLGVSAVTWLLTALFRGWLRQKHREERAFILAGFGALLSLTLHGFVEFNMSIPAIPATLAAMTGAAMAAVRHRSQLPRIAE